MARSDRLEAGPRGHKGRGTEAEQQTARVAGGAGAHEKRATEKIRSTGGPEPRRRLRAETLSAAG
jgi:hypothetical protein